MQSWIEDGRTYYKLEGPLVLDWYPNQYLYIEDNSDFEAIVRSVDNDTATLELAINYREGHHSAWGVFAKNREQNFAFNVLMDPEIDFVTLLGTAGTGKTLLALAAGLTQTMDDKLYHEIVMTRETVPVGEDIGFLPGTEEEKMAPWMGALIDNLELLGKQEEDTDWEKDVTKNILMNKIKIRSLNFMRGRTFLGSGLNLLLCMNISSKFDFIN